MNKKLFIMICLALFSLPACARNLNDGGFLSIGQLNINEIKQEAKKLNEAYSAGHSIYDAVKGDLAGYYGHSNFQDPSRTNGWYRVADFLNWVEKEENNILNSHIDLGLKGNVPIKDLFLSGKEDERKIFYEYLGVRYIAELYGFKKIEKFKFMLGGRGNGASVFSAIIINTNPVEKLNFIGFINVGIHEGTHSMLHENSGGELSTFYSAQKHALPVKKSDAYLNGVRNPALACKLSGADRSLILREYLEYYAGIFSWNKFSINESYKGGDDSLRRFLKVHAAAKKGVVYYEKKRSTAEARQGATFKELVKSVCPSGNCLGGVYDIISSDKIFAPKNRDEVFVFPSKNGEYELVINYPKDSKLSMELLGESYYPEYPEIIEYKRYSAQEHFDGWKKNNPYASAKVFDFITYITQTLTDGGAAFNGKFYYTLSKEGELQTLTFDGAADRSNWEFDNELDEVIAGREKEIVSSICKFLKDNNAYIPPVPEGYY
ncbi:hypothetical protein Dip510_000902 [Elusimicrobium posterum]|uniref:hypothetical protein n=1 Tax=Elusimicrobium posterum TaxID=3116653 RepID=UPI003C773D90